MFDLFSHVPSIARLASLGFLQDEDHRMRLLADLIPIKWSSQGEDLAEVESLYLDIISREIGERF